MSGRGRPRKWSPSQKSEALAIAAERGAAAASRETGIPAGSIRAWVSVATASVVALVPDAAVQVVDADGALRAWRERRPALLNACSVGAHEAVEACRRAVAEDRGRDARDLSVACGVLIDKAQLLAGAATARTESVTWHANARLGADDPERVRLRAEIEQMKAELAELGDDEEGPPDAAA